MAAACLLVPGSVAAQAQLAEGRIEEIRIVGNRRIPESTIRYYLQAKENDAYTESQILRDYRNLLNTNFFEDATVKRTMGETGLIVIFEVRERPLIRALQYEGMSSFKESDVLERFRDMRVGLSVDSPFDPSKLPLARRALKMLLDQNGRPLGRVEISTESITSSSIRVIFHIDEGPKVRIGKITFEGNTLFSDDELRSALELTKERNMVTLFKGSDKYIEEKLEYDLQVNMLEKYRELGHIFARAGEPKVEILEASRGWLIGFRKTKQQYYITIPIEENERYTYGSFEIEGVNSLPVEQIRAGYNIVPGEVVNYVALKESNEELKKAYSQSGYLDVTVFPEINPDRNKKTVDVTLRVEEGKQYIVHRVNFAGNTKTRDKVLRREFFLEEQQQFHGPLLDLSILRLNQLGFFEKIEEDDYDVIKRPNEGEVDIVVNVEEKSQQSIGLTGGVSGISGSFFGINYSSNNFRGLGQRIDVQLLTGTRTATYRFAFTEPYFMDTRISMGLSVFNQRFDFDTFTAFFGLISPSDNITLFTRNDTGFNISGSYPIWRWTRLGLRYSLSDISIDNIDPLFESFAVNQLIGFTPGGGVETARKGLIRSEITPSLVYNTKNQLFSATQGTQITVEVPFSGGPLGGNFNIVRPFVEYQKFFPDRWLSRRRHTFAFRAQFQHLFSHGRVGDQDVSQVPFFERIFSGGEFTFRGFDIRSITPWAVTKLVQTDSTGRPVIDPTTGLPSIQESLVPVGGDTSMIVTGEYRIPLVGPLQLTAFVDAGTVTTLNKDIRLFGPDTFIEVLDNTNNIFRMSTGAEVQFLLPVVNQPFRLIFAYNPFVLDTSVVVNGVRFPLQEPKSNIRFTVGYTF